nr:hypothetical protein [Tanacetum cinerariifolium]
MSTQQDIYAAGFKNRPPMLNKDNYVLWSSHLLRYVKSKQNGKRLVNSIKNGPYIDDELTKKETKQIEVGDQQMMKGYEIGAQDKKAKLFHEWERVTSTDEESIESYYHHLANAMNMALVLMAKAFKLNYSTPTNKKQRISSNPCNRQIAQSGMTMRQDRQMQMVRGQIAGNLNAYNVVKNIMNQVRSYNCRGMGHLARNCIVRPRRRDATYLQTQLLIVQKEEPGIQLQPEEFDLMAAAGDIDEIDKVNANCILIANLKQTSTSETQTDKAIIYNSDRSAETHHYENCYNNDIFNMFIQEKQYTELLDPITEPLDPITEPHAV